MWLLNASVCFISGEGAELTQIAATSLKSEKSFNQYILPAGNVTKKAREITGLDVVRHSGKRVLTHDAEVVSALPILEGATSFIAWLHDLKTHLGIEGRFIFIAHNNVRFDMRHIMRQFSACNLAEQLDEIVCGFGDSLPYFQSVYKGKVQGFGQQSLCSEILNMQYDAHDAVADTNSLKTLINHTLSNSDINIFDYCWSFESCNTYLQYCDNKNSNVKTLKVLNTQKVISKSMINKIGGSGLRYEHLMCAFKRDGSEGLSNILSAKVNNKIRVTKRKEIITSISKHFEKLMQ